MNRRLAQAWWNAKKKEPEDKRFEMPPFHSEKYEKVLHMWTNLVPVMLLGEQTKPNCVHVGRKTCITTRATPKHAEAFADFR